jgi:hypothetical protein
VTVVLSLYVALWGFREFAQGSSTGLVLAILFPRHRRGRMIYGKKAFAKLKSCRESYGILLITSRRPC